MKRTSAKSNKEEDIEIEIGNAPEEEGEYEDELKEKEEDK